MSHRPLLDTLTERELDIARLIVDGLSNHEIAQQLVLTHGTVKWYCGQIYSKLGVNSRAQAVKSLKTLRLLESPTASSPSSGNVRLPTPLTPLIGRQREIVAVLHLLQANRLLTLTGTGGTGKTRLALAVAEEAASEFADGVTFVDLAPITDTSLVAKAIAHALGAMENANEVLLDTLKRALAEQELLLLMDNFEHLIEGAPIIPQLLASAPRVKILITSREALRVSGEQEYAVPPLTLPVIEGSSVQDIQQSESVTLFQQRAAMIRPDFALTDDHIPIVAEICVRLDGLPLAIELAAARCKLLSPQAMLARLSSRLNTLTGGGRDAPTRQQTLRSTIAWSYNLLDDGEKMLFARLAVFRGGRSLEAIEAICSEGLSIDVINGLASLVDKSLVQQKENARGEPRFAMLETLHEYAWERLMESGEAEAMRRRHAAYFVALVERAEPELRLSQQVNWYQILELEQENLRAVLEWSLSGGDVALGLRTAGALQLYWFAYGYHAEGYDWTQRLLPRMEAASTAYHPKFLVSAANIATLVDLDTAKRLFTRACAIARESGDQHQLAWALTLSASTMLGEVEQAMSIAQEGLSLFRELDDKAGIAQALNMIGEIARVQGDDLRARDAYEETLTITQQMGDVRRTYVIFANLSVIFRHEGDYGRSIDLIRRALVMCRQMNNKNDMATGLPLLAGTLGLAGEPEKAARLLGAAETALSRIGAFIETTDKAENERINREVRALLDEATFQAAWAEGAKMSLEQAMAEALDE